MEKDFKQVLKEIKEGAIEKTAQISHVSYYLLDKTVYSFHFYAVYDRNGKDVLTELFYDLRYKKYSLKRNGKEVRFNVANLDTVIPRLIGGYSRLTGFNSAQSIDQFLEMVSVEENAGMYKAMLNAVGSIGGETVDMTSRAFIRLITTYNKLELLYKAGVDVSSMHNENFRQYVYKASQNDVKKIHEIFEVTKAQYKFMREFAVNNSLFAKKVKYAKHLTQQDMDTYRGYIKHIEELQEKYNMDDRLEIFKDNSSFSSYIDAVWKKNTNYGAYDDREFYSFVAEYNISNPYKLIEYLLFECYNSQGIDFRVAFSEYRDYYRMCVDLEYENFTKYPRYLKTYHDIVTRNYVSVQDEIMNKKFAQVVDRYRHLETTIGDFAIVVPKEAKELVHEGNVLHHCVGGYIKKVAEGKSLIVFLRGKKEKEEPLVTVEIRGNAIVQVQGSVSRYPTTEEKGVLKTFAKRKELEFKSVI